MTALQDIALCCKILSPFFMVLSGVNYVAYFYIMTKQLKEIFKVEEIRVYFGIILGAGTFIALNIRSLYGSLGEAFRHAFFQVGSINHNLWICELQTLICGRRHPR